ncbi:helix-turn-helix domain-containing protein [Kitasatospora sp. NPDC056783]|uniref:helix-turn-helix domain-containing protein n=1 Tax=Kitasatospora sp. NPDC056783 TaxID=3345943 RepID=UPI0036CDE579
MTLTPDAPPSALIGLEFARNLHAAMEAGRLTDRAVAKAAGLSHPTIGHLKRGEVLPDLGTILLLEIATGTSLYPANLYRRVAHRPPTIES